MDTPMRLPIFAVTALLALAACTPIRGTDDGSRAPETISERARQPEGEQPKAIPPPEAPAERQTYTREEILNSAKSFFGGTTSELAGVIERAFSEYGEPVAYIEGEEGGAAFVVGLRYGQGYLQYKGGGRGPVFWQGPSAGFDFGGNASKVFTLVYNLRQTDKLFQRYPGVDGSLYVVAGLGLNYLRSGDVVLAPIRTGVGLRAGASVGYLHFTREPSYVPF
jgi:hypothetical protein